MAYTTEYAPYKFFSVPGELELTTFFESYTAQIMKTRSPFKKVNEEDVIIRLNDYNDMFSDFDNRSFHNRMLSGDLLEEIKKMVLELPKKSRVILKFQLNNGQRDEYSEMVIIKNLIHYYQHHNDEICEELKENNRKGYLFAFVGFLIISIPVLLSLLVNIDSFSNHFYLMVEPFGWFLAFTGLDKIFQNSRNTKTTLYYYSKMLEAKMVFISSCAVETIEMRKVTHAFTEVAKPSFNEISLSFTSH